MPSWFETVPDVVETPAADSERLERRLTPAQQRAVAYVKEHRGLKSSQIPGLARARCTAWPRPESWPASTASSIRPSTRNDSADRGGRALNKRKTWQRLARLRLPKFGRLPTTRPSTIRQRRRSTKSEINLRAWFLPYVDDATAVQIADFIAADPDGFREVVWGMLKKARAPRGSKMAAKRAA